MIRRPSVPAASSCGRCGGALAASQEYCLACGLRRPGPGRLGSLPARKGRTFLTALFLALVAAGGAAAAIALTQDEARALEVVTAIGGNVDAPSAVEADASTLTAWPRRDGWTIVLVTIPKVEGRDPALAVAERARQRGLLQVGILDSGRFASTHPGFWLVVAGVYDTQPQAAGALRPARAVAKTARVQRIAR
jgi:hypothetical protein